MFGSGISSSYVNQLSIVAAGICDRVDKMHVNVAVDTTFHDSPATVKPLGFGQPIDHPDLQAMTTHGTGIFGVAVRMIADALGQTTEGHYMQAGSEFLPASPSPVGRSTRTAGSSRSPAAARFRSQHAREFMVRRHIMTATPSLNAIPAMVAAPPDIVTYADLPLILPRGVVPAS